VLGEQARHAVDAKLDPVAETELIAVEGAFLGAGVPLAEECSKPAGGWSPGSDRGCLRRSRRRATGRDARRRVRRRRRSSPDRPSSRTDPALEHGAVLVEAVVAVQRRARPVMRDRVLDSEPDIDSNLYRRNPCLLDNRGGSRDRSGDRPTPSESSPQPAPAAWPPPLPGFGYRQAKAAVARRTGQSAESSPPVALQNK
jgi:hypothetical protein